MISLAAATPRPSANFQLRQSQPGDDLTRRRIMWQAAVRKANAAYSELKHAERSYLAAAEHAKKR